MKNIITEVVVTESDADTAYARLTPIGERTDQFLYWLMRELTKMTRDSLLRIRNTDLVIDRRNVTSIVLTLSF